MRLAQRKRWTCFILDITGTDYKWVTCRRTNRALRKTPSFGEHTKDWVNTLYWGKNLAPQVSPLVAFWRTNYVWPTYGPNGFAMTWPTQVLRRPFVGGFFQGKPKQYLFLTCQHKSYLRWEKDLDKGRVSHSGLLLSIHGERLASLGGHRIEQNPRIPSVKIGDTSIWETTAL